MNPFVIHNEKEIKGFFGSYRFLSNFWPTNVSFQNHLFVSVEHAFVAAKGYSSPDFEFREDWEVWLNKLFASKAGEAKALGRQITLPEDWDASIKDDLMGSLVFDKFYRNKPLRLELLKTKTKYLEESNNWHDNYWGVCYCNKCGLSSAIQPQNNLGKILMKVREFWS